MGKHRTRNNSLWDIEHRKSIEGSTYLRKKKINKKRDKLSHGSQTTVRFIGSTQRPEIFCLGVLP